MTYKYTVAFAKATKIVIAAALIVGGKMKLGRKKDSYSHCPNCNHELKYYPKYKPCACCKKEYDSRKHHNKESKYCSQECSRASRKLNEEKRRESLINRFESKFIKGPEQECWIWNAYINKSGYGIIGHGERRGQNGLAHRVSYMLNVGEIPKGLLVRHDCDNPPCVNPSHLRLGNYQDNVDDMVNRGRSYYANRKGISNSFMAKITERTARSIKIDFHNGLTAAEIINKHAVSKHIVWDIKSGKTWKHVNIKEST